MESFSVFDAESKTSQQHNYSCLKFSHGARLKKKYSAQRNLPTHYTMFFISRHLGQRLSSYPEMLKYVSLEHEFLLYS